MRNSQSGFERWNELLNETVEKLQIANRRKDFQLSGADSSANPRLAVKKVTTTELK